MAKTTATIDPIKQIDTGTYLFYGRPVPRNVSNMTWQISPDWGDPIVLWTVRGSPEVHRFAFTNEVTSETILAALVAMRMSC